MGYNFTRRQIFDFPIDSCMGLTKQYSANALSVIKLKGLYKVNKLMFL